MGCRALVLYLVANVQLVLVLLFYYYLLAPGLVHSWAVKDKSIALLCVMYVIP